MAHPPFCVPELGIAYLRLYRDFTIQQRIYETIVPILEQARIEEQRDTPTLLVLDKPVVPEMAYAPRKRVIVTIFFFIALIVSIGIAFMRESLERLKNGQPEEYEKLSRGVRGLTQWMKKGGDESNEEVAP